MTEKEVQSAEAQGEKNEKHYGEEAVEMPYTWATSFAEHDAQEAAEEAVEEIDELTKLFNVMVQNIMFNYDVQDRISAVQNLTDEYQARITSLMNDGGIKAVSFDDSEWSGAKSNWDTAEAYCKDCLIDLNPTGEDKTKALCKLPYRKPGSTSPNKAALRTMATGRGISAIKRPAGVDEAVFTAKKKIAATKLIGWWKMAFDEIAPESIFEAAGKERPAEKATMEQKTSWFREIKGFFLGTKSLDVYQSGLKLTKGADGKPWILLWSTNSFQDREKEIFSTQSIDDFVGRHEEDAIKGEVWFCHLPGSKFANIKMQARVGRFLLEAAPFDDTEMGQAFEKFFNENPDSHPILAPNGWGQSHGYRFKRKDRVDGIYTSFEKYESTILPWDIAANQHNPRPTFTTEGDFMNEKQKEAFESVFGAELVSRMVSQGETKTAELEATGVAYKAVEEEVAEVVEEAAPETAEVEAVEEVAEVVEEKAAETEVEETVVEVETVVEFLEIEPVTREEIAEGMKVIVEALTEQFETMVQEKVSAAIVELIEVVVPLAKQVKELADTDEQKIAKSVTETPSSSLAAMIQGSIIGSKATQVDGRTSLAKDGPEETETKESNGPTVAGVNLNLWN